MIILVPVALGIALGVSVGFITVKIMLKREEKKLKKDAVRAIKGEIKNSYMYDGEEYPANVFKLRDEKNKEQKIEFEPFIGR